MSQNVSLNDWPFQVRGGPAPNFIKGCAIILSSLAIQMSCIVAILLVTAIIFLLISVFLAPIVAGAEFDSGVGLAEFIPSSIICIGLGLRFAPLSTQLFENGRRMLPQLHGLAWLRATQKSPVLLLRQFTDDELAGGWKSWWVTVSANR
jgi:hypothetical protein